MMNTKKNVDNDFTGAMGMLDTATQAFEAVTGYAIQIMAAPARVPAGDRQPDAVLHINMPGGKAKKYYAHLKGTIAKATIGYVAEQIGRVEKSGILVTRHVNPPMAERLKTMGIAFIDTAGNAYINDPPVFIYIVGRKDRDVPAKHMTARAFRPTGLKVVFALLCQPELARAPYREIVNVTHVAQGTVGWVMNDLKQQNFLADRGKHGRKLMNAARLFDAWVEAYARELRPKLFIGTYTTTNNEWWRDIDWRKTTACLGGEPAAAILTDYLKPETITVYTPENPNQFLLRHQLKKDPHGDVELFKKFWSIQYPWNYEGIAPPLLVYADLMATGNDRNIETARMIYDKYIHQFIKTV